MDVVYISYEILVGLYVCKDADAQALMVTNSRSYFRRQILATQVCLSGACLHHLQLEEGHAKRVRKGEETEGAHQGFGCLVS